MGYNIGIDATRVWASTDVPEYTVGDCGESGDGKAYVFVKADASGITDKFAAIIGAAFVASMASTTTSAPGAGAGLPVGFAQATIAANGWGWLMVRGTTNIQVAASCALGTQLNTTGTAGQLDDDASSGAEVINGVALTAARGGSAGLANAMLTYPSVGRTL